MDVWADVWTWVWLGAGAFLMAAELAVPGLVVVFLGMAAVVVALGRWLGLWTSPMGSLTAWFTWSIVFLVILRSLVLRWFPGESTVQATDEDSEAFGQIVEVVTGVNAKDPAGRIRYQGTSWPAISLQGDIPAGRKARLLARDNLAWVVEPVEDTELPFDSGESST
jgi:membrane protein implicated in regulation of membrane protease activity